MTREQNIERWDSFLLKIKERATELFDSARGQAFTLFVESGNDSIPIGNALSAIRIQMLELCSKADDAWEQKVRDLLYCSGVHDDELDLEEKKRDQLRYTLESDFTVMEMEIRNQMALHIVKMAQQQVKTISCTQCLAQLEVPLHLYQSEHLVCKFCQTVNTYEPGTYQRMAGGFFHDIARWKAIEECKAEMEVRYALQQATEGTQQKVKSAHRIAFKAYCEKYLAELKALNPTTDTEKELSFEMQRFDS